VSKYLNRGGEIWEKREDGSEHELFAADVINRLVGLETELAELKNKRCEFCREMPQTENEKAYLAEFGDKKGDLPTMAEWLLTKQNKTKQTLNL